MVAKCWKWIENEIKNHFQFNRVPEIDMSCQMRYEYEYKKQIISPQIQDLGYRSLAYLYSISFLTFRNSDSQ